MDNPKYIQVMRQVASDFDGISHELFQVASDLERMDQYNPQQKLFSLVRSAEVSSVTLRNLTARTVRDDTAPFYCEVADLLGISQSYISRLEKRIVSRLRREMLRMS